MTTTYPIRTITADEYPAFIELDSQAFLDTWQPEQIELSREVVEFDRTIAALDGEQMVGSAGAYSFRMTVPGGVVPAAGITFVAVLPSHRRRGILTGLMTRLLDEAAARSEPVAILFASEAVIYGRFGFGLASLHQRFTIGRGEGRLAVGAASGSAADSPAEPRIRAASPQAAQPELARVFDTALARRPGMLARNSRWWGYLLRDPKALRPPGMTELRCVLAEDDNGPRGYALYRAKQGWGEDHMPAGTLHVRELYANDPAATAALWTDLLSRDLVGEVIAPMRPIDDPLLAMLADRRRARPSPADGLWVRLVDLPAALSQRAYAASTDLVLEVTDSVIPANAGRWRLRTSGPRAADPARCERTTDPADLRLTVGALGAAYLGGASLGQLAGAGHVAELTPGALTALAAATCWDIAPYSGMMF
jgi:predicted acetyltransferase